MSRSSCQSGHTRRSRLSCSAGRFAPARTAPRASPSASSLLAVLAAAEPAVAADASARALRARPRAADPRRCWAALANSRKNLYEQSNQKKKHLLGVLLYLWLQSTTG